MEQQRERELQVERLCAASSAQLRAILRYGLPVSRVGVDRLRVRVDKLPNATRWTTYLPSDNVVRLSDLAGENTGA